MQRIIEELHDLGLRDKHITIIQALYGKKMDAKRLCIETHIPQGRIYSFLKEMIQVGLIRRSPKKPFIYSMEDVAEQISSFLRYKFDEVARKQERIIEYLEEKAPLEEIEIVSNGAEFASKVLQLLAQTSSLKTIVRHGSIPFTLYPDNIKGFESVRKIVLEQRVTLMHTTHETTRLIYRGVQSSMKKGNLLPSIMEKRALEATFQSIEKTLGKSFLHQMIAHLREKLKRHQIPLYIVDEYIPMQIFISAKKVFLSIIHLGVTTGIIIRSRRVVNLYNDFYDDMVARAQPIEDYLNQYSLKNEKKIIKQH